MKIKKGKQKKEKEKDNYESDDDSEGLPDFLEDLPDHDPHVAEARRWQSYADIYCGIDVAADSRNGGGINHALPILYVS
jgi:hypothetical protein